MAQDGIMDAKGSVLSQLTICVIHRKMDPVCMRFQKCFSLEHVIVFKSYLPFVIRPERSETNYLCYS
jgi:hypothetical protein